VAVCNIFLVAVVVFQPFAKQLHNQLSILIHFLLFTTLLCGLFLKMESEVRVAKQQQKDADRVVMITTVCLIASCVSVLSVAVATLVGAYFGIKDSVRHSKKMLWEAFFYRSDVMRFVRRRVTDSDLRVIEFDDFNDREHLRALNWLLQFLVTTERAFDDDAPKQFYALTAEPSATCLHVMKAVIVDSEVRGYAFLNKYLEYKAKLEGANAWIFEMDWQKDWRDQKGKPGQAAAFAWRTRVEGHFARVPQLLMSHDNRDGATYAPGPWRSGRVRVSVAFRVEPDEGVAKSIMRGNLANLASRDPGFYGTGLYLSFDPEYLINIYKTSKDGTKIKSPIALTLFASVFGNSYPVIEGVSEEDKAGLLAAQGKARSEYTSTRSEGLLGRAMVAKSDSHLVVVGTPEGSWKKDPANGGFVPGVGPVDPHKQRNMKGVAHIHRDGRRLDGSKSGLMRTEIVLRDESQVMPIGYLLLHRETGLALHEAIGPTRDVDGSEVHKQPMRSRELSLGEGRGNHTISWFENPLSQKESC